MTERWRKRLGDLDGATPSEDVFHRAFDGPQIPDEHIPRPSTGSRIVTGVAAFLVFALAIGVFAIPALRMHEQAGSPAGVGLQPLWPARTDEDLAALQAQADAGDAEWATDPEAVAVRFGHEVMGWENVDATDLSASEGLYPLRASAVPCPISVPSVEPTASLAAYACGVSAIVTGSGSYIASAAPTTGAPSLYRTISITDPSSRMYPNASLRLSQPLERGDGGIWAVVEVTSPQLSVSAEAGNQLEEGDRLRADTYSDIPGVVGFGVGSGDCFFGAETRLLTMSEASPGPGPETPVPSIMYSGGELRIELGQRADSCPSADAGYAWVATSFEDQVGDPFDGSSVPLVGLTAVPVIITS